MCIDHLAILCMIFDAGPYAAPHTGVWLGVHPVVPRTHLRKIDQSTGLRMLSGEDVVVQRPLVVIEILDRKSTRLNSSHVKISYAVFCLKKKKHTDTYT